MKYYYIRVILERLAAIHNEDSARWGIPWFWVEDARMALRLLDEELRTPEVADLERMVGL